MNKRKRKKYAKYLRYREFGDKAPLKVFQFAEYTQMRRKNKYPFGFSVRWKQANRYWIVPMLMLCLLFGGCKTIRQETVHTEHDSSVQVRILRDSIIVAQRDSVFLYRSPDSVYKEVWRIRYRDRDRLKVDTVFVEKIRTDTIVRVCTDSNNKKNSRRGFTAFAVTLAVIAVLLLALLMYRRNG